MSGKAAKTQLTTRMHEILTQMASSRNVGKAIVVRAKIILMAFERNNNQTIASQLAIFRKTVGLWRRRWRDSFAALLQMQFTESDAAFKRAIMECLSDAPRSGSPGKFTAEQIVGLMRNGSFTSKFDLIEKLRRFIDYFNETIASPMNWTYTGRPTRNKPKVRPRTWRELRQVNKPWKELDLMDMNL